MIKAEQTSELNSTQLEGHEKRIGKLETEMETCEGRLHDIDKKIIALKKGNNETLEMNINSKFEDLKKMFAELDAFNKLGEKVNTLELNQNDFTRKIARVQ